MLSDALIHASASSDLERTADLVELGLSDLRRRQSGTIIDWVELVSDDELQMRPLLATAKAWSRLVIGDLTVLSSGWMWPKVRCAIHGR